MKVKKIVIDGIAGISHLELVFNDSINVLCGGNGIGKSTVLDVIADAFSNGVPSKLKRNALFEEGKYTIEIIVASRLLTQENAVSVFLPEDQDYRGAWANYSKDLFYFGINRHIDYRRLNAISSDPERFIHIVGGLAINGINAEDVKNWFVNRYLFSGKEESLAKEQIANHHLAIRTFSALDKDVCFKTVNAQSFDIMLTTKKGDIFFEYLSSGYKSCIFILLGIIKEIEFRYKDTPIEVECFEGVVLIDEIDLHLHPIWQSRLVETLRELFPNVQFILTTHSPSVLQSLSPNEIIALGTDERGNTIRKELQLGEYGLQGWTLEEILKDIMEMPMTTSELYKKTLENFDEAMNNENGEEILRQYEVLKEMLHPENPLRKLLSIQVAQWEE